MMSDFERIRLVLLGGPGVGKSCIVRRFLNKTYCDKYKPTVEDLHNREYDLGSVSLKVSWRENCSTRRICVEIRLIKNYHLGGHFGHFRWHAISGYATTFNSNRTCFPSRLFGHVGTKFYGCEAMLWGNQRTKSWFSGEISMAILR